MISPYTPSGTRVAAINDASDGPAHVLPNLVVGRIYTVDVILEAKDGDFCVRVREVDHSRPARFIRWKFWIRKTRWAYALECFDYVQDITVFREILAGKPIDEHAPEGPRRERRKAPL